MGPVEHQSDSVKMSSKIYFALLALIFVVAATASAEEEQEIAGEKCDATGRCWPRCRFFAGWNIQNSWIKLKGNCQDMGCRELGKEYSCRPLMTSRTQTCIDCVCSRWKPTKSE